MAATRRLVQAGFLGLTLVAVFVLGRHAEAWCPFGGIETLYGYFTEGNLLCSLAISNFYILAAVLLMTVLFRRAFCGYVCPIGTLSDWLGRGAAAVGWRAPRVGGRLDRGLSLLKYAVLGLILFLTWRSSELIFRGFDPCYALISRHGEDITFWAYVVAGAVVVASLLLVLPFCRWLCPLAAVLDPFARFGVARIKRDTEACAGCGQCDRACPMAIDVSQQEVVRAGRCLSCLRCVSACPPKLRSKGAIAWGPPGPAGRRWPQAVLVGGIIACIAGAVVATRAVPLPSYVYMRGEAIAEPALVELQVTGLTCRGRASLLTYFIDRDDEFAVPGFVRVEAWPGPGYVPVRVWFDPGQTDESAVQLALTSPYYDAGADIWRTPPFEVEGFDPLAGFE